MRTIRNAALFIAMISLGFSQMGGCGGGSNGTSRPSSSTPPPAGTLEPESFSLVSPANGATGIGTTPTLTWTPSSRQQSYVVHVATDANFQNYVVNIVAVLGTSYNVFPPLTNSTTYYWRIYATNDYGMVEATGSPWSFRVADVTPTPPSSFSLLTPINGPAIATLTPTYSWQTATGATSYTLQVSRDSAFGSFELNQSGIPATSYAQPAPLNAATTYYWRVTAVNGAGSTPCSSNFQFQTPQNLPGPFDLTSPSNGSIDVSRTPTFSWTPSGGATGYRLQVSDDSLFSHVVIDQSNITGTSMASPLTLSADTLYYWKVTASNGAGSASPSFFPFSFRTLNSAGVPGTFNIVSPSNGSTLTSNSVGFKWSGSSGADSYTLQVSKDANFATLSLNLTGLTGIFTGPYTLATNTRYYARMTAVNASGNTPSNGGNPISFTTGDSVPPPPID